MTDARPERFRIEIGGAEPDDLYDRVLGVEVELDDELAAYFTVRLAMAQSADGGWPLADRNDLVAWRPVRIVAGFGGGDEELIDGLITHVRAVFEPDPARCALEVCGMDRSVLLDRVHVHKAWPSRRDSDVATEILTDHGLKPAVDDTSVSHDEAVSTIMQCETDMQLLTRLALRNGFECYVEGKTGFFRAPRLDDPPQPVLAAHFGDDTNLRRFAVAVDATVPTEVTAAQIDRFTKEVVEVTTTATKQTAFGATGAADLPRGGVDPARTALTRVPVTGAAELDTLTQAVFDQGEWFVHAEGEIAANVYGHMLRPRRTVTIKGVGEAHSGVYYVSHVTHVFNADGYVQRFRARRNGLRPTGDERFTDDQGLLGGLL